MLFRSLNTLGDAETREAWRAALIEHFEAHRAELSEDSLDRLSRNPLRILDSKDSRDRPAADSAPDIDAFLPPKRLRSEEHTSELQSLMRISYAVFCSTKKRKQTT